VPYAATFSHSVTSGTAGSRTVYAFFRDAFNNTSLAATDTIIFDATAPTNGTVTATLSGANVNVAASGVSDPGSGIASYRIVAQLGSLPAASCTNGTVLSEGPGTSTTHTAPGSGTWYYRVCATDNAGNTAAGATASVVVP
jgi:hypothetical protein